MSVNLSPSSNTRSNLSELQAPLDSSDTATSRIGSFGGCCSVRGFSCSTRSYISKCDAANESETVLSQVRHISQNHGISVTTPDRLPSSLVRPSGSFLEGISALPSDFDTLHVMTLLPTSVLSEYSFYYKLVVKPRHNNKSQCT